MTTEIKPDGYCAWHPEDGFTDCYDYNENDCFNKWGEVYLPHQPSRVRALSVFLKENWQIKPVCLVPPDLLQWVEKIRITLKQQCFNPNSSWYNYFIELDQIWPEKEAGE